MSQVPLPVPPGARQQAERPNPWVRSHQSATEGGWRAPYEVEHLNQVTWSDAAAQGLRLIAADGEGCLSIEDSFRLVWPQPAPTTVIARLTQALERQEEEIARLRRRLDALEQPRSPRAAAAEDGPDAIQVVQQWIQKNRPLYKGKWIALQSGELKGVGDSMSELVQDLARRGDKVSGKFVTRVP